MSSNPPPKKNILIIGGGAVGAIAALNLETGGLATVTLVLRSNFKQVNEKGYHIQSCDHGVLRGWRPSYVRNTVPDIEKEGLESYDYIVVTTKNIPDIGPSIADLIAPAMPNGNTETSVMLLQNGLNIEKPLFSAYPGTVVLSGISMIASAETAPGVIIQEDKDRLLVGAFPSTTPLHKAETTPFKAESESKAREFVRLYSAGGKTECVFSPNVLHDRWRKLVYNACLNPICAMTGLDTGRIRLTDSGIEGLVRPAMKEIVAAAKAVGVELDEGVDQKVIDVDPLELYLKPSMLADVEKGNYIEFENLLGEPLREGKKAGVPMPTLEVLYQIAKVVQWRTKERRGAVEIPPKREMGGE